MDLALRGLASSDKETFLNGASGVEDRRNVTFADGVNRRRMGIYPDLATTCHARSLASSLWQRWPDAALIRGFPVLREALGTLAEERRRGGEALAVHADAAFEHLCRSLAGLPESTQKCHHGRADAVAAWMAALEESRSNGAGHFDLVQRAASQMGMLMHLSCGSAGDSGLVNARRPGKPYTTYPTSPAVARVAADYVLSRLLTEPLPARCRGARDAERFAKRALRFRLLDPSMESGQLLLQVALSLIRLVRSRHAAGTKAAYYLVRALLERLCAECLWGVDHNPRAIVAVRAAFALLGRRLEIPELEPENLFQADSLKSTGKARLCGFDGVLNNPPWGELIDNEARHNIRRFSATRHRVESYVGFAELTVRSLRPGGAFAIMLPSQSLATRNSCGMRELLLRETCLDHIVLLPQSAFADATVRGLVLLGRVRPAARTSRSVCVTVYPTVKGLYRKGPVQSSRLPIGALEALGGQPWSPALIAAQSPSSGVRSVPLGDVADVLSGVNLARRERGMSGKQSVANRRRLLSVSGRRRGAVPAVKGSDVREFRVNKPSHYLRVEPPLQEIARHRSISRSERVYIRELCRRDGKLNAALAPPGTIPMAGVHTVVPRDIDPLVLVAVMNSRVAAEYVRCHTASFTKVDFQKITVQELRQMPIPVAALNAHSRRRLGLGRPVKHETNKRSQVRRLARKLVDGTLTRMHQMDAARQEIEPAVEHLYRPTKGGAHA